MQTESTAWSHELLFPQFPQPSGLSPVPSVSCSKLVGHAPGGAPSLNTLAARTSPLPFPVASLLPPLLSTAPSACSHSQHPNVCLTLLPRALPSAYSLLLRKWSLKGCLFIQTPLPYTSIMCPVFTGAWLLLFPRKCILIA